MKSAFRIPVIIFMVAFFLRGTDLIAQQNTWLGIGLFSNYDYYEYIQPEAGVFFERQLTEHSGFETGIFYRIYQSEPYVNLLGQPYYPHINEKYITIPVSYKHYSGILNASIGVSYDYFLGWRLASGTINLTTFNPESFYYLGVVGRVSKVLNIDSDFALEPELKANILALPHIRPFYGVGIKMKFNLQGGAGQ